MKKIMFNDRFRLTQAVLEGIKTQIRILVPNVVFTLQWDIREMPDGFHTICVENTYGEFVDIRDTKFSRYKLGEVVAIAQCYKELYPNADFEMVGDGFMTESAGWNNKMFVQANLMKRHIKITDVKVERLQDISDEDCLCEGVGAFLKRICIAGAEKFEKTADYLHWLECHDADPGISYCRRCATEKAAEMNICCTGEEYGIGGGCEAEYDAPCSCEECGNPLKFNFCGNTGIDLRCLDLEYTSDLHILNQVLSRGGEDEKETVHMFARKAFTSLIDNISGKGTWESNPWVEAYSFELID